MRILVLVMAAAFSVGSCTRNPSPMLAPPDAPVAAETRAAVVPSAARPMAGGGDVGASLIQLEVDVTSSGGGEDEPRVWRVTARTPSGEELVANTRAIQLSARAARSSDGTIVVDRLSVAFELIESTVRSLVLQDGERTIILEETDPALGSVTIAVTAAMNRGSVRPRP